MRQMRTPAERSAELAPRGAFAAVRLELLEQVVSWRAYRGGKHLHRPEPLTTELHHEQAARWLDDDAVDASSDEGLPRDAVRVGFDASGSPLVARAIGIFPGQGKHQLFVWHDELLEVLNTRWTEDSTRRVVVVHLRRDADGRIFETRDDEDTVVTYRYDADGRLAGWDSHGRWNETHACEYDGDGELARIVRTDGGHVEWQAIRHRHEPLLPPAAQLIHDAAPGLTRALAAGIRAEAAQLPAPRYALFSTGGVLEPGCAVVDLAHAATTIRHDPDPAAPLLGHAGETDSMREVDVIAHADPATQQRLRQWEQGQRLAMRDDSAAPRPDEQLNALFEGILEQLNEPAAEIGIPVVPWGDPDAAQELLAALRAELPDAANAPRPALPERLEPDRKALRALLRVQGLGTAADTIADDACVAIGLADTTATVRSRIGGVPSLPAGMEWPARKPGRPLTPLASIDCAELPAAADERGLLPDDGTLLLFADLRADEADEIVHGIRTGRDGWFVVLHVPAGTPLWQPDPPRELLERTEEDGAGLLPEQPVEPRLLLTLRDGSSAARQLGLDAGEASVYARVADLAWQSRDGIVGQLLGHPLAGQGDPREPEEALVLALAASAGLPVGAMGLQGLFVLGAAGDLRARRWEHLRLIAEIG
jgi:YD repeat-containing protein